MENTTLIGRKLNMTQIFLPNGKVVPVTKVKLESADVFSKADNFLNEEVTITGTSKGKGFAGGIKKWGFHKQGETRGAKDKVRAIGAIGSQTPGRVYKGKKMPGRMGSKTVTIKGLEIVGADKEESIVMVSGSIPGARNSEIAIKFDKDIFGNKEESNK